MGPAFSRWVNGWGMTYLSGMSARASQVHRVPYSVLLSWIRLSFLISFRRCLGKWLLLCWSCTTPPIPREALEDGLSLSPVPCTTTPLLTPLLSVRCDETMEGSLWWLFAVLGNLMKRRQSLTYSESLASSMHRGGMEWFGSDGVGLAWTGSAPATIG